MEISKTIINVLIVTAILLIGVSVTSVLMKKPVEVVNIVPTPTETTVEPVVEETTTISTTTDTTTDTSTSTNTSTSSSSLISNKNFTDKKWMWVRTTISGTSTTPKKANVFTIMFNQDLSIKGTTDCNSYFGSYKLTSTNLSFGPIGSTKMFCEGSQETDFLNILQKVVGYTIDANNNLVLSTGSGTMVFK